MKRFRIVVDRLEGIRVGIETGPVVEVGLAHLQELLCRYEQAGLEVWPVGETSYRASGEGVELKITIESFERTAN